MALQSSPPISMNDICSEFGAPLSTPLHQFVRGGSWVPNTPQNSGVPTSVPISMLQLLGASRVQVVMQNLTAYHGAFQPNTAYAELQFSGTTVRRRAGTGLYVNEYTWLISGASANQFQARATLQSGATPSGNALNTWITLGSNVGWSLSRTGLGDAMCTLLVQVRLASTGEVFASGTWTIHAEITG